MVLGPDGRGAAEPPSGAGCAAFHRGRPVGAQPQPAPAQALVGLDIRGDPLGSSL